LERLGVRSDGADARPLIARIPGHTYHHVVRRVLGGRMQRRPRPPVAALPIRTQRTVLSFIVNALLVRAPDDPRTEHHRAHGVLLDESLDLATDRGIDSDVHLAPVPPLEERHLCALPRHNADGHLGRSRRVGPAERDRVYAIAAR